MIDLNYTGDQRQILEAARAMLASSLPVERLRAERPAPDDLEPITEFGGFTMSLSEDGGGSGLTILEDVLLHRELGRHLVSPSALARTVAVRLAHDAGKADLAAALAEGSVKVCLGNWLAAAGHRGGLAYRADEDGNLHLYDADDADLVLVIDRERVSLLDLAGVERRTMASTDRSVRLSIATVAKNSVLPHAEGSAAGRLARLLISAQLLGVCEAVRDMSVAYANVRTQFGQPIGAFQAVKHRCANMAIQTEVLSAQLDFAALAEVGGWPDASSQIDACWLLACRYTLDNCRSAIQVHGGIGFTAECDAHLYLLRAQLYENLGATNTTRQQMVLAGRFWPYMAPDQRGMPATGK